MNKKVSFRFIRCQWRMCQNRLEVELYDAKRWSSPAYTFLGNFHVTNMKYLKEGTRTNTKTIQRSHSTTFTSSFRSYCAVSFSSSIHFWMFFIRTPFQNILQIIIIIQFIHYGIYNNNNTFTHLFVIFVVIGERINVERYLKSTRSSYNSHKII